MEQAEHNILVLADGQRPPVGTSIPPRTPKWTDTFTYIADPDKFCSVNLAQYGPIFKSSVFGGTTVFVGSASANQMVFNGDSSYTAIGLPPTTMEMFGEHSLFQRPDLHRQRKGALRPAFTGQLLAGYLPRMHQVIKQHIQSWDTTTSIHLVPSLEALSFDVLAPLLLGINLEDGDAAFEDLPVSSKAELKRLYNIFFDGFYGLLKWKSPITAFGRGQKARSKLLEFMRAIIQKRRRESINPTTDFLAMMLANQKDNPAGVFTDALIENQCLLQLWASHYEMLGLLASWMYQLGQYPDILEQVRMEYAQVTAGISNLDEVGMDQFKAMIFIDATIKEVLRTLPPSSTANRRLTKSVVLDGVLYEKGWSLIAEPRITHAMSDYFSHPDQFDPERFLPARGEGKAYEFIPFGGGVHACLGMQLALLMAKVFAIHLLNLIEWQIIEKAEFVQFPLKRIKNNYKIQVNRRAGT